MTGRDRDLWLVSGTALLCAAVVVTVPVIAVRAVFAVPFCLVLPGYALTAAIFPRHLLGGLHTVLLAVALSLATLVLCALLLDPVPGGLRVASWTTVLVLVVLGACTVATTRSAPRPTRPNRRFRVSAREVILMAFAALVISASLVASRIPLGAHNALGYTQLWMLQSGTAQAPAVRIGVLSAEQHVKTYRLVLATGSGQPTVVEPDFTLAPGSRTEVDVPVSGSLPAQSIVTARLYESGGASVYREATALISTPSAAADRRSSVP